MDIKPAEISAILKKQIADFGSEAEVAEVGPVALAHLRSYDEVRFRQLKLVVALAADGIDTQDHVEALRIGGELFQVGPEPVELLPDPVTDVGGLENVDPEAEGLEPDIAQQAD